MPKLLAVTHNHIGPTVTNSRPNQVTESGNNVVTTISGEWYLKEYPFRPKETDEPQAVRCYLFKQLYDEKLLKNQRPDALLLYIGMGNDGDIVEAMNFAKCAAEYSHIHLVWPVEKSQRSNLYRELGNWMLKSTRLGVPTVHFAESTGNLTMERLVKEFLETGRIQDPAEYRLPT